MDKIKEEFSKVSKLFNCWMSIKFTEDEITFDVIEGNTNAVPFYAGYKSRDEEIRELEAFKKIYYPLLESGDIANQQLKAEIKRLKLVCSDLIENIQYFVDRVEAGTIRSKRTYAIYKNLLSKYETLKGGE